MNRLFLAAVSILALTVSLASTPAQADMLKYKADLTAPGEVPPNDSRGTGTIEATYDTATKTLSWSGSYADLTGPEIAAHFHGPAAKGVNAGVLVPVDAK